MRIGLFTDSFLPNINGVSTSVLTLKNNLEAAGHQVFVFTTTNPDASGDEPGVYRIPGVSFKTQRLGTFVSPSLHLTVKKLSLDIIHTHTEYTLGNFGRNTARRHGIPFVHTMHTIYEYYTDYIIHTGQFENTLRAAARKFTAFFCNQADVVIAPTEKTKRLLIAYGTRKEIKVIPTGIPLEKFSEDQCDMDRVASIRSELGIRGSDRVLLSIGRVSNEKNLGELLCMLQEYLLLHPNTILLIVGDGPDRKLLENLAEYLEIQDQVIFAGARPWADINLYYRLGDIFVSASESETQGLTYTEAMASGLPVVAKADDCLTGLLVDDVNGHAYTDKQELLDAIDRLLSKDEIRKQFSKNALDSARKFSGSAYGENVAALYKELIAAAIKGNE